jgi:hypothetical protein
MEPSLVMCPCPDLPPWQHVYLEWIACGCPDLPPAEVAFMRLFAACEADGWRGREKGAHDKDLLRAARALVDFLRTIGARVALVDGQPIAGPRELIEPYLPEMRALREQTIAVLRG